MTNARPEKISIEFETTSQGWDSHTISNKHYMDGYNQSHAEWTAYIDELLKPLGEIYEKYKDTFYTGVFRDPNEPKQAMWNAIKTLIDTHRNTSKDKIVRLTHQTRVKIRGYEKAAKALKSAIDSGEVFKKGQP